MPTLPRLLALCICLALGLSASGQTRPAAAPSPAPSGRCYALLVAGTPGTPLYARHYRDWIGRLQAQLKKSAGASLGEIVTLSEQTDVPGRTGDATLASIGQALTALAAKVSPQDQFVLLLLGHGGADGSLVLKGPDLGPEALAEMLKGIRSQRQIVLQFSGCSGAAVPALAQAGRIVLTSNGATQAGDSDFAEFLLLAMEGQLPGPATRPVAGDNPRSLLHLFNTASHEYAQWITRQQQTEGGWAVEGRRSRAIFERLYSGDDVPSGRKLAPGAADAGEDLELPMVPSLDTNYWSARRLVTEQPMLEDTGAGEGVSALGGEGYKPIEAAKAGSSGALARRTVLGQAEPLVP